MKQIVNFRDLNSKEKDLLISELFFKKNNKRKNYHYLSFGFSLGGLNDNLNYFFKNLLTYSNILYSKLKNENVVNSFYPKFKITIFPTIKNNHCLDIESKYIKKNFDEVYRLNEKIYKTKYLVVCLDKYENTHLYRKILPYLKTFLHKSKYLKRIYIIKDYWDEPEEELNKRNNFGNN